MDHIAIMKKAWGLTTKILKGEKTIETRWYKNRVTPWNKVKACETIYFKDSGEPVTVKATVQKVEQYELKSEDEVITLYKNLNQKDLGADTITNVISDYVKGKKFAIIIYLEKPTKVKPFHISKKGYGVMSAWICVDKISDIIINETKNN